MLIYIYIYKIAISDNAFILAKGRFLFLFFIKRKKKKLVQKLKILKNYLFVRNEICIWMKKILDELNLFK